MTIKRMGVLAHPTRPQTAPVAERIADTLRQAGLEVCLYTRWTEADVRDPICQMDMVIAIGGDGAMLHAARVCAPGNVPVLGLNMGYLGFLTEIRDPNAWEEHLNAVLAGHYWIEKRMMVRVEAWRDGDGLLRPIAVSDALNDVVISRGTLTRTVRLDTYIDHEWTTTYNADALIISTATGSTAYALASGGPILPPELRNILIVPVAPHLSLDRPIVLPEGAKVEVVVPSEHQEEIVLSADGTLIATLRPDDRVLVQASEHVSQFVRLRARNYFYRSLLDRLEPRMPSPRKPGRRLPPTQDEE
jgi:NAD+ kinase